MSMKFVGKVGWKRFENQTLIGKMTGLKPIILGGYNHWSDSKGCRFKVSRAVSAERGQLSRL